MKVQIIMNKKQSERNRIFIFNLETDLESQVLAAAHDWIEALSQQYENVEVYSTHVGRVELGANVTVSELGGGNLFYKLQNLYRLVKLVPKLWEFRHSAVVFHHMSSRTLAVLGLPICVMGLPQGIWYSHSKADFALKFGRRFADVIFSSTAKAIPLTGNKMAYLGHGIKIIREDSFEKSLGASARSGIVSLGRISQVKNVEELLLSFKGSQIRDIPVTLIGPESDPTYSAKLRSIAADLNVSLIFEGPKPHSEIHNELKNFKYIFSGTPMSVDKALLEGALAGCFAITSNLEGIRLSGMDEVWRRLDVTDQLSLEDQLQVLDMLAPSMESELREVLVRECISKNDLSQTVLKIRNTLDGIESRIEA